MNCDNSFIDCRSLNNFKSCIHSQHLNFFGNGFINQVLKLEQYSTAEIRTSLQAFQMDERSESCIPQACLRQGGKKVCDHKNLQRLVCYLDASLSQEDQALSEELMVLGQKVDAKSPWEVASRQRCSRIFKWDRADVHSLGSSVLTAINRQSGEGAQ